MAAEYGIEATLVNPRFATELDREFLDSLAAEHLRLSSPSRDGIWTALGLSAWHVIGMHAIAPRAPSASPRASPDRYDPNELLAQNGMTVENMAAETVRLLNE